MEKNRVYLPDLTSGEDKSSPLVNCMRNSYRHLRKWAKRTQTDCFRLYERDISHYPVVIDFYAGRFCVHFFAKEDHEPSQELKNEVNQAICSLFNSSVDKIYWRTRKKSKTTRQYERISQSREFFDSVEFGVKFYINLVDYLDTGLFLDHRETRQIVAKLSQGKRILNLFAYTCSFSLHAALAGASFTKSVDMSNTYTEWGRENFILNGVSLKNHQIVRADCLKFLDEEISSSIKYDLIIIDPPTISRSKKMDQLFDINVDYISLVKKALRLLADKGIIFFSTNSRKFTFDETLFKECHMEEISYKTLPLDFKDPKIHRCWKITI